jgi:hypothetical protein
MAKEGPRRPLGNARGKRQSAVSVRASRRISRGADRARSAPASSAIALAGRDWPIRFKRDGLKWLRVTLTFNDKRLPLKIAG